MLYLIYRAFMPSFFIHIQSRMLNMKFFAALPFAICLTACSANNSSVSTTTSPIDGKVRTVISGSDFSTSYIYLFLQVVQDANKGGSVTDQTVSTIVFETTSTDGFREAFFKADEKIYNLKPTAALTDFSSDKYGINATKEFFISCNDLVAVSKSLDVYLRVTFADGFVDYDVSKSNFGADGFGMIKKIASYCTKTES